MLHRVDVKAKTIGDGIWRWGTRRPGHGNAWEGEVRVRERQNRVCAREAIASGRR
jgi:hypothetical protein